MIFQSWVITPTPNPDCLRLDLTDTARDCYCENIGVTFSTAARMHDCNITRWSPFAVPRCWSVCMLLIGLLAPTLVLSAGTTDLDEARGCLVVHGAQSLRYNRRYRYH